MASTNKGIKDLIQLKLDKRMLEEKLSNTDNKMTQLRGILHGKKSSNNSLSGGSTTSSWNEKILVNPLGKADEFFVTKSGLPVSDFRYPAKAERQEHIRRKDFKMDDVEPQVFSNPAIVNRRTNIACRINGAAIVNNLVMKNEQAKKKKESKIKTKIYPSIKVAESMLPNRYIRGELPCTIEHGINGHYLSWACPLENLDYEYYLPIFFDGLQTKSHPAAFLARQGIEDMLIASHGHPERIIGCIPNIVRPLRNALSKFDTSILLIVLKILQQLVTCNAGIGEVLMPYCKQFLAPMCTFMDECKNIGDQIDYGQRKNDDVGEEIRKTLELMEETGGPKALTSIKFSIPLCM
jgi:hypothetical protein